MKSLLTDPGRAFLDTPDAASSEISDANIAPLETEQEQKKQAADELVQRQEESRKKIDEDEKLRQSQSDLTEESEKESIHRNTAILNASLNEQIRTGEISPVQAMSMAVAHNRHNGVETQNIGEAVPGKRPLFSHLSPGINI